MGRHSDRSRRCQTCRQRRVKVYRTLIMLGCRLASNLDCWLTRESALKFTPDCSQYLRIGKRCSRPLIRALIIDMFSKVQQHSVLSRKVEKQRVLDLQPLNPHVTSGMECVSKVPDMYTISMGHQAPWLRESNALPLAYSSAVIGETSKAGHLQLPIYHQRSRLEPFQQHLTAHFVACFFTLQYFKASEKVCEHKLPNHLSGSINDAIVLSIRATTMAFYGQLRGDRSIQIDACR